MKRQGFNTDRKYNNETKGLHFSSKHMRTREMRGETVLCCIFQKRHKLKGIVKTRRSEIQLKFFYITSPIIRNQPREHKCHRVEEYNAMSEDKLLYFYLQFCFNLFVSWWWEKLDSLASFGTIFIIIFPEYYLKTSSKKKRPLQNNQHTEQQVIQ